MTIVPSRPLRWLNGSIHWISAVVLLYAFVSNGESNDAMTSSAAMRGEVRLGLVVGVFFLARFLWVSSKVSAGGRWTVALVPPSRSLIRMLMNLGIYFGVAGSIVSGLLIAYLRPGAQVIPNTRGLTARVPLNLAINAHVSITNALEWLCAFHVVYYVWLWGKGRTRWTRAAQRWINRTLAGFGHQLVSRFGTEEPFGS